MPVSLFSCRHTDLPSLWKLKCYILSSKNYFVASTSFAVVPSSKLPHFVLIRIMSKNLLDNCQPSFF